MPGPAILGIAGSIGSAGVGLIGANKAAKAQKGAANSQIAESRRQFDLVQKLLKPYVSAGNVGLEAQLALMGIGGNEGTAAPIEVFTPGVGWEAFDPEAVAQRNAAPVQQPGFGGTNDRMGSFGAAGFGAQPMAPVLAGPQRLRVAGREFGSPAEAQAYASANRTGVMTAEEAQRAAIAKISGGEQYKAMAQQGEYALLANEAATGGLRGGDTAGALAQFRPQLLQSLIDRQLANFGGIAANGQAAAGMTGTAAQNTAGQINQALGDRGAAGAGGALAGRDAIQDGIAGLLKVAGQGFGSGNFAPATSPRPRVNPF